MKITIDGNIGSGKSTLITKLEKHYKKYQYPNKLNSIILTQEPVHLWKPYLENFYNDMKNNCLALQMKILNHHLSVPTGISNNKLNLSITERSTVSCIDIFGKYLLNDKLLSDLDIDLMIDYETKFGIKPDLYIYIQTTPEECYNRINIRNRGSEEIISINYLRKIDTLYNEKYNSNNTSINYYVIDGNKDQIEIFNNTEQIINKYMLNSLISI